MSITLQKILIIVKPDHVQARELGKEICNWLDKKGFYYEFITTSELSKKQPKVRPDLGVVLGGDGTLLYVARRFLEYNIPFMGINFGRVGFLAEISPDKWESYFNDVFIHEKYFLCKRTVLCYKVRGEDKLLHSGCSINDIVISRHGMARLLEMRIFIGEDSEPMTFRADGVIVSSPNGSTGYCAAAGGSLIYPELDVIEICPICPFLSRIRPLIIPGSMGIKIEITGSPQIASLTIDGQEEIRLCSHGKIEIIRHEREVCFLMPTSSSYIKKLKDKGYI